MKKIPKHLRACGGAASICVLFAGAMLSGPAATALQMRAHIPTVTDHIDAIYLVCGARAQSRRLETMHNWLLLQPDESAIEIWIGNDTQNSLWSRKHQRNLTRAQWAYEHATANSPGNKIMILPGSFSNTDGEMHTLARHMANQPDTKSVAFVTCGFHARRVLDRFTRHDTAATTIYIIAVKPHWENRAPWIVAAEWMKILRDRLNLSQHPWISRQPLVTR
jgi:hypothetical protein